MDARGEVNEPLIFTRGSLRSLTGIPDWSFVQLGE